MNSLNITGIGAVTPLGLSAPSSAAGLRAGISRLGPILSSEVDAAAGGTEPAIGGRVPLEWFEGGPQVEEWPGHERFEHPFPPPEHLVIEHGAERLIRLAVPAASESWRRSGRRGVAPANWGLFLGIDTEETAETRERLVAAVTNALDGLRPAVLETLPEGRAAGLAAIHHAAAAILSGKIAGAVVGGVDSLVRPEVHARLMAGGVLKDANANPQGIRPGEAAAFLVLEAPSRGDTPLALLAGTGEAEEPTAGTDQPNQGRGLTSAIRAARSAAPLPYVPLMICDLNGERYRALEWMLAYPRSLGDLKWRYDLPTCGEFWHPADCMGDAGPASGVVDCVWAVEALRKGYALTERVLVWGASEGRLRAAAILAPPK